MAKIRYVTLSKLGVLLFFCTLPFTNLFAQSTPLNSDILPDSIPTTIIEDIIVIGKREPLTTLDKPLNISTINRETIGRGHNSSPLPSLVEQVPGLFITSRSIMGYGVSGGAAGGISIRGIGGSPDRAVAVLIDGEPQQMGLMGHPIADFYSSSTLQQVEVTLGPASVRYGSGAMGGAINIVTKRGSKPGFNAEIDCGFGSHHTLQSSISASYTRPKWSVDISGLYDSTKGHRKDMEFERYGTSLSAGVKLSQHLRVALTASISHFNASNPGTIYSPLIDNDSRITRGMATLSLKSNYPFGSGALTLNLNLGRHRIDDGYGVGESPKEMLFISHDRHYKFSAYQNFRLFKGNTTTIGVEFSRPEGRAENLHTSTSERTPITERSINELGAYIDINQSVVKWLKVGAGIRFSHHSVAGREWIPQASITTTPSPHTELSARFAKGFRYPSIGELFMFPSQNPDLRPESIYSYELIFRQRFSNNRLALLINLFYIDGKDIIKTEVVESRPQNLNISRVKNCGLECELSASAASWLHLRCNYSLLDMRYPTLSAPKHKLYAEAMVTGKRWHISSGIQHISGLYLRLSSSESSALTESYTLWNLRIEFRLGRLLTIWGRAENLLDQTYQINYGYPMPGVTLMTGIKLNI